MKLILCFLFIFSSPSFAKKSEDKFVQKQKYEKKRWNQILKLIQQEMKTIETVKRKTAQLRYRMFELKTEELKLYKEKENKEFVAKKMKYGNKITRKQAFSKTLKLYRETHDYGVKHIKRYPESKYKAAIYYTLALNSRDFAYDKVELGYLLSAIRFSKNHEKLRHMARTSLSEYYYNNKDYKKAVKNYRLVIKDKNDEWLTKNLYNYGWCLLKTHKFAEAINMLEQGHRLSTDEYYIDMRNQIMTSLVSFYVYGKEIDRGVKFIDKYGQDKNATFLKLARKAAAKGYFPETERIVADLNKRIDIKTEAELYADLKLFQFDLYTQYHKFNKRLEIASLLPKMKMNKMQKEESVQKISSAVGIQQIILKKDFSKHEQKYKKSTLQHIITYFNILSAIDPKEKAAYEYYKGETHYSVHRFQSALNSYKISLKSYDKKKSKSDLRQKNLDAIFSCIDLIKFNKKDKQDNLIFAYNKYLSYWPKDQKAQKIYPRLFNLYVTRSDFPRMQRDLDRYVKAFPKDNKIQKNLYRTQMDMLIKQEKTKLLAAKITKIKRGYLNFPKEEIKKSETILANILFGRFQQLSKEGKNEEALAGYTAIHLEKFYPRSIKAEAAFNIGIIHTNSERNALALGWYNKSFKFFTRKEKDTKRVFIEKMALRTELLHNFTYASKLNKFVLRHYCKYKKQNTQMFTKAIQNDLVTNNIGKVNYTLKNYSKCISKVDNDLKKEILAHLYDNRMETKMHSFIETHNMLDSHRDTVAYYYEKLYWENYQKNSFKEKSYLSKIKAIKYDKKAKLLVSSLKKYKALVKKVSRYQNKVITTKEMKDPNVFSNQLQERLGKLQPIIKDADEVFSLGHGQVSVLVYDQLTSLTKSLSSEISRYSLPINDKEFQKQFKAQMKALAGNISTEHSKYTQAAQSLIEKYELLLTARADSHPSQEILKVTDIRSPASLQAITSGRGL